MPGIIPGRTIRPPVRGLSRFLLAGLMRCRNLPVALVVGAYLVFGATVAGSATNPPPSPLATDDPTPRRGGTLRYIQEPAGSLDPKVAGDVYGCTVANQIHRGLLQYSNNLTPVPCLARTWTISRDGLEYTFEIRPGVRFQHGREVTADDVIYSIERIFKPGGDTGLAGQYLAVIAGGPEYHLGRAKHVRGLTALGRYTVQIRLSQPSGSFLWSLAMVQASVVPRDVIEKIGDAEFGRHPIGCGPFQLVSVDSAEIRLGAFDGFFRGRAYLDSLVFMTPQSGASTLGTDMLLKGRVDLAEIPGFRRSEVMRTSGLRLISRRELSLSFVGINSDLPPLNNPHIRRALAFATDRDAMLKANPEGHLIPTGVLPPGMSCYSPELKVLGYDPAAAQRELAAAGYPDGRGLEPIPYFASRSSTRSRKADSLLIAGWRRAGIPVRIELTTWAKLSVGVENGRMPLFGLSWVADIPDPDSFLGALFASTSPYNYFRYRNAEVDSLLNQGRVLVDPRTRGAIYKTIERSVLSEGAMIPLFNSTLAYGLRSQVHGVEITPLGISCIDFAHVWMEVGRGETAGTQ